MKYFKMFPEHNDYVDFTGTTDFIKPNLSYCVQEKDVHFSTTYKKINFTGINAELKLKQAYVALGSSASLDIIVKEDYYITSAIITMDSQDITQSCWNQVLEKVNIPEVTGDISINIIAEKLALGKAYIPTINIMQGSSTTINTYTTLSADDAGKYTMIEITTPIQNCSWISGSINSNYTTYPTGTGTGCVHFPGPNEVHSAINLNAIGEVNYIPAGKRLLSTVLIQNTEANSPGKYVITSKITFTPTATYSFQTILNILPYQRLILNNTDINIYTEKHIRDVTINKTVNENEWTGICLPFDLTQEQIATAFGNDVSIATFTDFDYDANDNIILRFNTKSNTTMNKNTPYIIKCSSSLTQLQFDNVFLDADEDAAFDEYGSGRNIYATLYGTLHYQNSPEYFITLSNKIFTISSGMESALGYDILLYIKEIEEDAPYVLDIYLAINGTIQSGYSRS